MRVLAEGTIAQGFRITEYPFEPVPGFTSAFGAEMRRLALHEAQAADHARRVHGYHARRFRDVLRAMLTPDTRAPRTGGA